MLLLSEAGRNALHGAAFADVLPLLDGQRSAAEIAAALHGRVPPSLVAEVLARLDRGGHSTPSRPADPPPPEAAFWEAQGLNATAARQALARARIALRPFGGIDPAPLRAALHGLSIAADADGPPDLTIALTDNYLDPALAALEATGRPLLLLRPRGLQVWIGPLLCPGQTPPLAALTERLAAQSLARRLAGEDTWPLEAARAGLPATAPLACSVAAIEVARYLAGLPCRLLGAVLSLDTLTWFSRLHPLLPLPGPAPAAAPITLRQTPASHRADHGHRSVSAEQTLARYEHLVSPITGLVPGIAEATPPGSPFPVFAAGLNPAGRLHHLRDLRKTLRFNASGKGASAAQSRASALCEALERVSAIHRADMPQQVASLAEMRARHGNAVIHPNAVMGISNRQFALREVWNATASAFHRVPHRLPAELPVLWSPLWSLTQGEWRYLPTQLLTLFAPAGPGLPERHEIAVGCGNGLAAGNTLEEAILQGLCELIERDATAIWWYNRLRRPGIDPLAFGDAATAALLAAESGRRRIWALDLTHDLGVPVYCAVGADADARGSAPFFGLGCHPDPRIALQRAFGEWHQLATAAAHIAPSDSSSELAEWLNKASCAQHPYLCAHADAPPAPRPRISASGDLRTDIEALVALLAEAGLEVLVMELTHPAIGLPVAKVVVPGLRHFWARFAPGRLYEVPVALGWQAAPLAEEALNPIPVFI